MKKLLFIVALIIASNTLAQEVLSSQAEVDAFFDQHPGPDVQNQLWISGPDIVDLSGLNHIESVERLRIYDNPLLTTTAGLEDLTIVEGRVDIYNNATLVSIDNLIINSHPVVSALRVYDNPMILSLDGMEGMTHINFLWIENNSSLINLDGLAGITLFEPTGDILSFYIVDNENLQNINGLSNAQLLGAGPITFSGNSSLTSLESFSEVDFFVTSLEVRDNDSLSNLNDFSLLQGETSEVVISENDMLENIDDLWDYDNAFLFFLEITNNPLLANCDIEFICNYLANPQTAIVSGNATGCNSTNEILNECTLGLTRTETNEILVLYPNPVSEKLHLLFPEGITAETATLHSITGEKISTTFERTMDVSILPKGIYFVTIATNKGVISKNFIKE